MLKSHTNMLDYENKQLGFLVKSKTSVEPKKIKSVSFFKIQFFQAKPLDYFIMIFGLLGSFGIGLAQPLFAWLYGSILNELSILQYDPRRIDNINHFIIRLYIFSIGMFFSGFVMIALWIYNGRVTSERIRSHYFRTILKQEQGWFDASIPYEFSTKVESQITKIDNALGEKISTLLMGIAQVITGYTIGFTTCWKLSLIIFSLLPIFLFAGVWISKSTQVGLIKSRESYEKAGGIAEEVLYNIKTVASFTNFEYEKQRYEQKVEETYKAATQSSFRTAIGIGIFVFGFYMTFALSIGYGSYEIYLGEKDKDGLPVFNVGNVMTVLFSMMYGAYGFGASAPVLKFVIEAKNAAIEFFELLERKPSFDTNASSLKPNKNDINGKFEFKNVDFIYPTKTHKTQIFNKLNLKIEPNKKTAIVGHSGCGKSTILNLLLRLYDIEDGKILLDDYYIDAIDINHYRSLIGYVPQEPVLFNNSIRENIVFGREGISETEIIEACKKAYAEEFINNNELGLDFVVGTKGSKLSGGQKQRIAIARAILNKPKILILDEATSALDNKSEKEVQKALDKVSQGITTIMVAHRLSTIKNADNIIVLETGRLVEQGTHEELYNRKGHYYELVKHDINAEDLTKGSSLGEPIDIAKDGIMSNKTLANNEIGDKTLLNDKILDKRYSLFNVMMENKCVVLAGTFFACCVGCSWILHAVLMGEAITNLANFNLDYVKTHGFWSAMKYIGFGVGTATATFLQNYLFTLQGDYLAKRYRSLVYEKFLKLDMSYFDVSTHSPGVLLSKLSSDSTLVNGVALGMFGVTIEIIVSSALGIAISIYYSWKIGLVNLAFYPILLYLSGLQWKMRSGIITTKDIELENKAANILSESICNTKTIFSYNMQDKVVDLYSNLLKHRHKAIIQQGITNGVLYGLFQFFLFANYATLFIVGAHFMIDQKDPLNLVSFLKSMLVSILTSFGLGSAQQYLGDISKGNESLKSLYDVLSEPVTINKETTNNMKLATNMKGRIEFKNVCFAYPTMPKSIIFDKFNLTIEPGQKVAFVGHSGCGKSTIIQLIERFYDVTSGELLIDGVNIKDYDLISLRKNISLVMQEPVLFKITNLDNIKYGKLDADEQSIYSVADKVGIGKFLKEDNLNTVPSGGEKQRLAIARALMRDPKILLLDEATSALDNEKEKFVQASLEVLMEGRTTIAVAHRLSTIEKYDVIYVMDKGRIVEFGNHEQLYLKEGIYYRLKNLSKQ
jgi:ATP-binding cassette subfamily B (MDR/TAP) protein 1